MDGTILVADDDRTIRTVLTQALTRAGCKVHATSSLTTLMRWVAEGRGDVVISDVVMPDGNGLEMLPKIAQDRPGLPVIVISAQNTIMTAIKAAEAEAYDYLPKPFDLPELMKRTARALDQRRPGRTPASKPAEAEREDLPMIGRTPVMQALYRVVARVMNTDLPVLIMGESGTGKSLIGRAIHDFSDRRSLPFVTVTGADLIDLEGPARVLARVRGGTLLIDEIGNIPDAVQARIVRMMDAPGEYAPRFLATSQSDLTEAMKSGKLREDLFYRLSGATLHVPALRDRVEDIELLAAHFLERADPGSATPRGLSEGAKRVFSLFAWPGNVRQLEHAMRQLALTSRAPEISQQEAEQIIGAQPATDVPLSATFGNQAKCADLLGINRNTLRKKITDLDIEVTRGRKMM